MGAVEILVISLTSSLCLYFLLTLIRGLHKLWWTPIHMKNQLSSQGIKGPSYRFFHGSTKEIINMKKEAMSRPMNLSHDIFSTILPHVHSWVDKYGNNYLQWFGPKAQLVVTEPELIKEIMNNRDNNYPKPETAPYTKKLLGDGLGTSEGAKWAKMRKLANSAFNAESLKNMIPSMISSIEVMLEGWKHHEGKEIEVSEEFRLLTSEVISRTAFGSSYLEGKNIFQMLMKLALISSRNAYKLRFPGIREEKVMSGEGSSFGGDFLQLLVEAHHDCNASFRISIEDLVDEYKTFYIAGQETTSTLLAWTMFLLAIHTDWQEKARKEVLNLFGQQNPNPDGITKLKTMGMIINESLRLYPPITAISRKVEREVRLGKLTLPANLLLYIPTLAPHHDPKIWGEDVHLFKPERFSEGIAKATNNNIAAFFSLWNRASKFKDCSFHDSTTLCLHPFPSLCPLTISASYHSPTTWSSSDATLIVKTRTGSKTFYIAGQETTSTLLAWTMFLLAIHTDWQEKARKEVLNLFGQQNPNPDGITKLKTMGMIINESLRLYPPVTAISRKVEREVRLGKLTLPANLLLYIPTLAPHHDPKIWGEDVHLFKPERFSEGIAKATNNNIAAFFSLWNRATKLFGVELCDN
ncbi:cytochrome p450 cyp749a22 [Quercus suber]|uniref:Cytochrome p450 cyp749a22 n=1 Tax=Quercus suber TaxID=58331 RepID=A0AAW0J5X0_QUESU